MNVFSLLSPQGTAKLIQKHPSLVSGDTVVGDTCSKNIGETKRLQHWSRGHQFIVRAGGHIEAWQPLYNATASKSTDIHDT